MPARTVKAQFFVYSGGRLAQRGQTVDFSDADAERGDSLGVFEEREDGTTGPSATDAIEGAFGDDEGRAESGLENQGTDNANTHNDVIDQVRAEEIGYTGPGITGGGEAAAPSGPPAPAASSAEGIDALTGDELDAACKEAGIDTTTGGSLTDGSLSADEKRAALKAHHGV